MPDPPASRKPHLANRIRTIFSFSFRRCALAAVGAYPTGGKWNVQTQPALGAIVGERHMIGSILWRKRVVDGREVQEPTLVTLGFIAAGFLVLLAVLAGAVFATASFALGWGLFA